MKIIRTITMLIILAYFALLFNGEIYAIHGIRALLNIPLLLFYILFISILSILIKKLNFNPLKIFFTGSFIGILLETFYTKSIFVSPLFLGVNWFSVLIQMLYWGMAATLPFYAYHLIKLKNYQDNQNLNTVILAYIFTEFLLGTILHYPTTIWVWIVTGAFLGIFVIKALQRKVLVFSGE